MLDDRGARMRTSSWIGWTVLLGVALGGFFDGILLHQVLQWHHFLSLVPGVDDLRLQILFDGYFHVFMYLLAVAALWGLVRARGRNAPAPGALALVAAVLLGFGLWNVIDVSLAHWILRLHRLRLDTSQPLWWDLGWLAVFGVVPIAGWAWLRRRPGGPANPAVAVCLLAALGGTTGAWSLRGPPDDRFTTVVFAPGSGPVQVFRALEATDARLVWADRGMGVVMVAVAPGQRWRFYGLGALLVGGTALGRGCVS